MSEEVPSSPLSSPPESVVNVRLGSPVEEDKVSPVSSNPVESKAETVAEPVAEPVAETITETITETIVTAKQPTTSPERKVDGEKKSLDHDSDGSAQSSLQKRKASLSNNPISIKKPRHVAPTVRKSAQDKKWEAPFVYTDSKSPLANADLRAILLHPLAWEILTPEEKRDVLAKFPDETHLLDAGTQDARPNPASLRNDDNFRYDCARYCENIELGRHDEEWLSQAWVAHEKHKRGDYNEFLRERFEAEWETKLPAGKKTEDPESDKVLKQDATKSSEGSSLGAEEATTPKPARRSTRSPQSTPKKGSPRGTRNGKSSGIDTKGVRAEAAGGSSRTSQPIDSSELHPSNPPAASQEQKVATSNVVAQSN